MKFLDRKYEGRQLIPLNIVSYEPFELGNRDAISITFKDVSTGKKYVEFIEKPKYEVYVLKPEYRASATFMANWAKMESWISIRSRIVIEILNFPRFWVVIPVRFGIPLSSLVMMSKSRIST